MCDDCNAEAVMVREQVTLMLDLERQRLQETSDQDLTDAERDMELACMVLKSYTIGDGVGITVGGLREVCLSYAVMAHKLIALQQESPT